MDTLYIIVPCYNEEKCIGNTAPVFLEKLGSLISSGAVSADSRILFVNDGSSDSTWDCIEKLHSQDFHYCAVGFAKNRGHQNALIAGLSESLEKADFTVTIDVDLQDDINAIDKMVEKYNNGAEIVCGVRDSRETDSFLKRFTARAYYAIMNLFGARFIADHADFRLMSREAAKKLLYYHGDKLYLRGLVTMLGIPIETVTYDRSERVSGESKYTLKKMLKLAASGFSCRRMKPSDTMRSESEHICCRLF